MRRYDSATEVQMQALPAESPLVLKAIGAAAGLATGVLLICLALDTPWQATWRVSVLAGASCLLVAGVGAFRRVICYAIGQAERVSRIDINGDGRVGPDIRLIPVKSNPTMGVERGMDVEDLRYMIARLDREHQRGWTVREWLNELLPSGREIVSAEIGPYAEFIAILERIGALVDRTERFKGRLVMDKTEIMNRLGL